MVASKAGGASRRRTVLLRAMLLATAAVTAGVVARVYVTHSLDTTNLVWNLVLAWIPFWLALALYDGARRGWTPGRLVGTGLVWLLFLPNAPYIVTDAKWLVHYDRSMRWIDLPLVLGAAAIGLVLGFVSLYLVQAVVARRLGRVAGWSLAWGALALSGVGIYLGRYQRWNSWDLLTEPTKIVGQLASAALDPLAYGRPLALSTFFAVACCVGYGVFYSAFRAQLDGLDER